MLLVDFRSSSGKRILYLLHIDPMRVFVPLTYFSSLALRRNRALEAIFISVISSLQSEMEVLVHFVTNLLAHLEESIDQNKLKELLQYSKKLSRFESKTLLIRDVFVEVLDQGKNMEQELPRCIMDVGTTPSLGSRD